MKKHTPILLLFILAKFILQYILVNPEYDLHRDEYLHLDQANHLAWGYISVPPLTSWIAWIIKALGNGVFWVKFFPALFGALTMVVVWKIIEELKGSLFALVLGSAAVLVSVILRINILFQPNSLDIFFWTLTYFTVIKYISTRSSKWLYATGVAVAFGILSKYNIVFLVLGLLPAILLTEHRKVFLNQHLYLSMGLALLLLLPNIIWQFQNEFPTFHQLNELNETQLVHVHRSVFIKEQFLFFLSSLFIIIAAFVAFFIYEPFKKYRLFFWSYFITLALFILLKAKGYYAIGLYPVLIAFGSVYLEKLFSQGWKKYLKPVSFLLVIAGAIPFFMIAFPVQSPAQIQADSQRYKAFGVLRWEDGKDHSMPQDFADMIGWSELAKKVDSTYGALADKGSTLVLCDNYGQAGAINYYSTFKNIGAVSFNADYINWFPLHKKLNHVILVKDVTDDDTTRRREKALFETVVLAGQNGNPYSREQGTKIYLLTGAKTDVNGVIR
ncbi:MAG TPA: glycosyltransferase family 39 protein, partial [Flavisolibacter sp.]|nr:glycosyltransferase family 39 protein [Flavisolibacter sp.]